MAVLRIPALALLVALAVACTSPAAVDPADEQLGAGDAADEGGPGQPSTDQATSDQTGAEPAGRDVEAGPVITRPTFPDPPEVPDGPLDPDLLATVLDTFDNQPGFDHALARTLADAGDPRILWVVSDQLRFTPGVAEQGPLVEVAGALTGVDFDPESFIWVDLTDMLIAWDLPAFEGYREAKAQIFTFYEPEWQPFFDDADADIDWRLLSWGGVFMDTRPLGETGRCERGCIPSLDDPALVTGEAGDWYPDDRIIFGIEVGGEAVALPKNIMQIHEMVNMDLGGRRLAIPYCTLCGAAQAWFSDVEGGGTGEIVMRTSGLLSRSNKVMVDLTTSSVFDTFTGQALSGPLHDDDVRLDQATVVTTSWGAWRDAHPDGAIIAEDGGIGRTYAEDPLRGRDDNGPIFPIGDVDPRLGVHDLVVGVELPGGGFVAFDVVSASHAIDDGRPVEAAGVTLIGGGWGFAAQLDGQPIPSHEAFWFAWSQFHPDTLLWPED